MLSVYSARHRRAWPYLVPVVAVVAGIVAVALIRDSSEYRPAPLSGPVAQAVDLDQAAPAVFPEPVAVGPASAFSAVAVTRLLDSEVAQDAVAGFDVLSAAERARLGSPQNWAAAHQNLPRVLSYTITGADLEAHQVVTEVQLEPRLDPIVGAFAASATITWQAVEEDGGFRVSYENSLVDMHYPDTASIPALVGQWATLAQDCASAASIELGAGLLGTPGLAGQLCGASGAVEVGALSGLETLTDPAFVINAFGPGAAEYSFVVPLKSPVSMLVVVAPLGDEWRVIGLAPA